jgi:hypothetical protein
MPTPPPAFTRFDLLRSASRLVGLPSRRHVVWALEEGKFWHNKLQWPKNRASATDLLLLNMMDDRWVNRDVFWDHVPSLILGPHER